MIRLLGHILVEFKARLENRDKVKTKLESLGAEYAGSYHQLDTYYKVPHGRLKLRELLNIEGAHLIYYERGDLEGPKQSKVWLAQVNDAKGMKCLLSQIFPQNVIVDKHREIYMYNGIQLHLDEVKGLGSYLEMEKKVADVEEQIKQGYQTLRDAMSILDIKTENLQPHSYSDLLKKPQFKDSLHNA